LIPEEKTGGEQFNEQHARSVNTGFDSTLQGSSKSYFIHEQTVAG
jgi:hypothetical protein